MIHSLLRFVFLFSTPHRNKTESNLEYQLCFHYILAFLSSNPMITLEFRKSLCEQQFQSTPVSGGLNPLASCDDRFFSNLVVFGGERNNNGEKSSVETIW